MYISLPDINTEYVKFFSFKIYMKFFFRVSLLLDKFYIRNLFVNLSYLSLEFFEISR